MRFIRSAIAACSVFLVPCTALTEPANVSTPSPVIHLADNLDEADGLGWCIDTVGRGLSDELHTHSCKPQGGDVQFSLDDSTGQIKSVAFDGKCMELIAPQDESVAFGLLDCDDGNSAQKFDFDAFTGRIMPVDHPELCVAAGAGSQSAGPFMSRALVLIDCASGTSELTTWVVR